MTGSKRLLQGLELMHFKSKCKQTRKWESWSFWFRIPYQPCLKVKKKKKDILTRLHNKSVQKILIILDPRVPFITINDTLHPTCVLAPGTSADNQSVSLWWGEQWDLRACFMILIRVTDRRSLKAAVSQNWGGALGGTAREGMQGKGAKVMGIWLLPCPPRHTESLCSIFFI